VLSGSCFGPFLTLFLHYKRKACSNVKGLRILMKEGSWNMILELGNKNGRVGNMI
jgi:hypothetical protein